MEGFELLALLSFSMFIGSYLSGYVPLAVSFSESRLRLVSVLGAGLLVGTALAVIIPEGVQSIYVAQELNHHHHSMPIHQAVSSGDPHRIVEREIKKEAPAESETKTDLNPNVLEKKTEAETLGKQQISDKDVLQEKKVTSPPILHQHSNDSETSMNVDVHSVIGVALVFGFVFMLIVDQVSSQSRFGSNLDSTPLRPRYKITATVGLVVHAAADGIALGAASTTKQVDIQFIVFIAIMLHKSPAAFGLVTFLLHEGLEKSRIRKHLMVFSLSAPCLAVITYLAISQGGSKTLSSLQTTGILMLFSAGTFLYVATVHVLPEIVSSSPHASQQTDLPSTSAGHSHFSGGPGFKPNELLALVVGAFLPIVLTLGHSHSH